MLLPISTLTLRIIKSTHQIMAYDIQLAEKITRIIKQHKVTFYIKEMMGGVTWMVEEKMCISIYKGGLMVRVEPMEQNVFLARQGAEQMIHGGKPMNGYLTITPEGFDRDEDLEYWVQKCLEYNPNAKASKKKKK
jgi:TfoX/Sxy family transcriptional regulator of competence genes